MLRPRIIPSLLINRNGMIKTREFKNPVYLGDILNAVRIFNDKEADEIVIFDIEASVKKREPDYRLIEKIARQSKIPVCYGGGIKTFDQASKILRAGIEKIALSSIIWEDPDLIRELSDKLGSQSVVCVFDVKKNHQGICEIYTHNAQNRINTTVKQAVELAGEKGAGEIIINCIDKDGTMQGYNHDILNYVQSLTDLPITILGGAGSVSDIGSLFSKHGIIGAAAGSLFVFNGRYRAVLINYPSQAEKLEIIKHFYGDSE